MKLATLFLLALLILPHTSAWPGDLARTLPHPSLTPLDVVKIQVAAMQANGPEDKGLAIVFNFASPQNKAFTGPLPRFAAMVKGPVYGRMLNHENARFERIDVTDDTASIDVILRTRKGMTVGFRFRLSRQADGAEAGNWMTDSVVPIEVVTL